MRSRVVSQLRLGRASSRRTIMRCIGLLGLRRRRKEAMLIPPVPFIPFIQDVQYA